MTSTPDERELNVLVLQGGGALGAYQARVFEALKATEYRPDWVAGISIGAINAALIAGNPPKRRVDRLREFWDLASSMRASELLATEALRPWFTELSTSWTALP